MILPGPHIAHKPGKDHHSNSGPFLYVASVACMVVALLGNNPPLSQETEREWSRNLSTLQSSPIKCSWDLLNRTSQAVHAVFPLGPQWVFFARLFVDLWASPEIILNIIQRESKWNPMSQSPKWAVGLMQIRPIVLDDMLLRPQRYQAHLLKISENTLNTIQDEKTRSIVVSLQSSLRDKNRIDMRTYGNVITSIRTNLYTPELNVILGTILLRILETEVTDKHIENYWKILNNLTREDIATINRFRIADWRKSLEHNYDFSNLDIYKVLALAWYNVWQNGKDTIKRWFLYALAVLA